MIEIFFTINFSVVQQSALLLIGKILNLGSDI